MGERQRGWVVGERQRGWVETEGVEGGTEGEGERRERARETWGGVIEIGE